MAVTTKMSVDVSGFVSGMRQAQQSVKTMDAALKKNEAQYKATGNAEDYMGQKSELLKQKLDQQKKIVDNAKNALAQMVSAGVDPASDSYQKMAQQLLNAETAMMETQNAMNGLDSSAKKAATGADNLTKSVNNISKKVSLDAVIRGIDSITGAMSKAATKAVSLGEAIWDNIMQSAQWGDDIATQAMMAQMSVEDYQRVVNVAATTGETSTDALIKSWKKVKMNLTSDSADVEDAFKQLGIAQADVIGHGKYGDAITQARDYMDVYWEIGEALMQMSDSAEQERLAQTLLGRSWQESIPMFLMGREAYEKALAEQDVNTEEQVNNLAVLNDTVREVEQKFETLKNTVIATIAPTLTTVADSIGGMLSKINEYLQTDEGQELLSRLGESIEKIFSSLANIDPESVVSSFVDVFDKLTSAFEWVAKNFSGVVTAIGAIGGAFAALKIGSGALKILELINGIKGLGGANGVLNAVEQIANGGGGGAVKEVLKTPTKALPWLKEAKELVKDVARPAAAAYLVYDLAVGSMVRAQESWNEDAAARAAELDRQESSFGDWSNPEYMNAWKEIRGHANDENFLDEMAKRYYMYDKSADVNSEYYDYEDPFWEAYRHAYDDNYISVDTYDRMKELMGKIITKQQMQEQGFTGGWETFDLMDTMELLNQLEAELAEAANAEPPQIPAELELPDDEAAQLAEQVGTVNVPAHMVYTDEADGEHANGLWSVPFDGYLARLHKSERIVPAREVQSRSYNSNLYVESMYMNNGMDAEGLAAAMASAQRRTMRGYGS